MLSWFVGCLFRVAFGEFEEEEETDNVRGISVSAVSSEIISLSAPSTSNSKIWILINFCLDEVYSFNWTLYPVICLIYYLNFHGIYGPLLHLLLQSNLTIFTIDLQLIAMDSLISFTMTLSNLGLWTVPCKSALLNEWATVLK